MTEATSENVLDFPCQACGASLRFEPGTTELRCQHCGAAQSIAENGNTIVEHDFQEGLARARMVAPGALAQHGREVQCQGCGARAVLTTQSDHCAFCGSPVVLDVREASALTIAPESLLPFALGPAAAREAFRKWVQTRWFAPNDLKRRAQTHGMDGVYLPYWTFDSFTTTRYVGQRGDYYYVTQHYKDAQGRSQTRQVRHTRWSSASGVVQVPFDDVLVAACTHLPQKFLESLEPWDLHGLQPFDPAYLSGFVTQGPNVDLERGFSRAQERMQPAIDVAIGRDIGGDVQRIHQRFIAHARTTFKHLLLPIWISAFRYHNKTYQIMINARTGEVCGQRPYSVAKIALASLAGLVLVAVIVYLVYAGQNR